MTIELTCAVEVVTVVVWSRVHWWRMLGVEANLSSFGLPDGPKCATKLELRRERENSEADLV